MWVAAMAGGPSTTALVAAAAQAGAFGFLAGGYKTAAAIRTEMDALRAAGTRNFGVNVFVPGSPASDGGAVSAYVGSLRADAARVGAEVREPASGAARAPPPMSPLLPHPPPA